MIQAKTLKTLRSNKPTRLILNSGFTLLESLIALGLGATLLLIVTQAVQSANQTEALIAQQTELQDNRRAAMQALQTEIGWAGYDDWHADPTLHPAYTFTKASSFNAFEVINTGNPSSQMLRLLSIRKDKDCLAQSINSYQLVPRPKDAKPSDLDTVRVTPVKAEFFLQNSAVDVVSTLYCRGSGNAGGQPVARGVEELVFRVLQNNAWYKIDDSRVVPTQSQAIEVCLVLSANANVALGNVRVQSSRPTCLRDSQGEFLGNVARSAGDKRLWQRSVALFPLWNRRG